MGSREGGAGAPAEATDVLGGPDRDGGASRVEELGQLESVIAVNWYEEACRPSRLGRQEETVQAPARSIDLGYIDVDHVKLDEDLDNIGNETVFKAIVDGLNHNEVVESCKPASLGEKATLLVALHGAGDDEAGILGKLIALAEARGVVIAAPRGPITSAKGQYDSRRRPGRRGRRHRKIVWTIEKAKAEQSVDPQQVFLLGIGGSGYFSSLVVLSRPEILKGAISVNAFWNKYHVKKAFDWLTSRPVTARREEARRATGEPADRKSPTLAPPGPGGQSSLIAGSDRSSPGGSMASSRAMMRTTCPGAGVTVFRSAGWVGLVVLFMGTIPSGCSNRGQEGGGEGVVGVAVETDGVDALARYGLAALTAVSETGEGRKIDEAVSRRESEYTLHWVKRVLKPGWTMQRQEMRFRFHSGVGEHGDDAVVVRSEHGGHAWTAVEAPVGNRLKGRRAQ